MSDLVYRQPCQHGRRRKHCTHGNAYGDCPNPCPGGSEIVLDRVVEHIWYCRAHQSISVTPGYLCDQARYLKAISGEPTECDKSPALLAALEETQ
jgi:hypothetical protein